MTSIKYPPKNRSIDLATILGIISSFALIFLAIRYSGNNSGFINIPSLVIVILGTLTITIACFNWRDVKTAMMNIGDMAFFETKHPRDIATFVVAIADALRTTPVMSLDEKLHIERCEPFFKRAIFLVMEGRSEQEITSILEQKIDTYICSSQQIISMIRKAAEVAPAMGLIGTLIGLVQMLQNLSNVEQIGPAMAISLLTTFYGALMSYVLLFPLASKMERNMQERVIIDKIYLQASLSIAKKENPRYLESSVNSLLKPEETLNYFK